MIKKTLVINGVTRNMVLCQDETLAKVRSEEHTSELQSR